MSARDLAAHVMQHHDTVQATCGVPITLLITDFCLDRGIILYDRSDEVVGVLHIDCTGTFGRSGPFVMQQGLVRICCLHGSAGIEVKIENRGIRDDCDVFETTKGVVPVNSNITTCRAIAHPTINASCEHVLEEAVFHSGIDVTSWWASATMREIRREINQDTVRKFPIIQKRHRVSAILLSMTFSERANSATVYGDC